MTNEEAINGFEIDNALLGNSEQGTIERNNLAIIALREQAEREKGCLSCNSDEWYFNRWCWIDEKGDPCHQKIKFCPMCGKRLEASR